MKSAGQSRFHASEFARRAGVSVRTLHYYDRLGLLRPQARTVAGYRLYRSEDFARLQQIVTLKFIGFPLREIKKILSGADLATALKLQRKTLEEKQRHLGQAVAAIAKVSRVLAEGHEPDWEAFAKIIEEIQMQTNYEWTKQYYNDEARKLLAERQEQWSPELQEEIEEKWAALFRDIEAAAVAGTDPAGPTAQQLTKRHAELIARFTGGHAVIADGLNKLWADQANWPDDGVKKLVFEPFAKRGMTSAREPATAVLSAKAEAFFENALNGQSHK